jgi:nucleoside-diphosphate-sugar epimerase
MSLLGRTLTIIGGNGFVGYHVAREASLLGAKVYAISKSGKPGLELSEPWGFNVNWIKGDAMNPNSFEKILKESHAVVHTVGTLLDTSITEFKKPGEEGTYEHMNIEAARAIGQKLQEIKGKKIVYLSASKSLPFIPRYLSTKLQAEEMLFSMSGLRTTVLRPGFIYSDDFPVKRLLSYAVNGYAHFFNFLNAITPYESGAKKALKSIEADMSIDVRGVAIAAVVSCFDPKLDGKVLYNHDMEELKDLFLEKGYEFPTA